MRAICANPASPLGENDFFRNQTGKLGLYHIPENKIRRFVKISQLRAFSALCATVGFSAITSANVVGYATDTLAQNKFTIKAIQFEDVASGKVDANKVLSGFTGVDFPSLPVG